MASTDTRSGFRLPWSSDRSKDEDQPESPDTAVGSADPTDMRETKSDDGTWPVVDTHVPPDTLDSDASPTDTDASSAPTPEEPQAMVDTVSVTAPKLAVAPKKPSKLIADLAAAMRTTAESAREQAVSQLEADATKVVEQIRAGATEGAAALHQRADDDIASIREWSKTEIARVREETDHRISDRKAALESEVAGHAAAIDRRVEAVERTVAEYQTEMADFIDRLLQEEDPGQLATIAETMPEPPTLDVLANLDDLEIDVAVSDDPATAAEAEAEAIAEASAEASAEAESGVEVDGTADAAPADDAEATVDQDGTDDADAGTETTGEAEGRGTAFDPWGADESWVKTSGATAVAEAPVEAPANESNPWGPAVHAAPDAGDAEREAMLSALEAAAEAIAAEHPATDAGSDGYEASMAQAEAEAGSLGAEDADAAMAARLAAADSAPDGADAASTELDQSVVDRLASLIPAGEEIDQSTLQHTQVAVTGLVSVASIASFKRHLNRTPGVQRVTVSSGPKGEFVFAVTHRDDVLLGDTIPTMPGFAARVTGVEDDVINVAARDPESEG